MSDIRIFSHSRVGQVRTAVNEKGEPMFCLSDVAKALGYTLPADAVSALCKGGRHFAAPYQRRHSANQV